MNNKSYAQESKEWILEYLYDGLRNTDNEFKDHFKSAINWLESINTEENTESSNYPKFTFDDVLAIQCAMFAIKNNDKELYKALTSIHDRIHDIYHNDDNSNFKPGTWITNGTDDPVYVNKCDHSGYELEDQNGHVFHFISPDYVNNNYHRWTVNDAKPGDILVDNWEELKYPLIFILKDFKKVNHGLCKPSDYHSFCYLKANDDHTFCVEGWHHKNDIQPANKEQRDLLFSKMKEAEYTWDSDTKELQKIKKEIVVSKFKVNEWITTDKESLQHPLMVVDIINNHYKLKNTNDEVINVGIELVDRFYRRWTIKDAHEGDIIGNDSIICIFREFDNYGLVVTPCIYTYGDGFSVVDEDDFSVGSCNLKPVTNKEREFFLKKMHEKGIEWDELRKELLQKNNAYCLQNCKGYQETGKCYCDGECDAKINADLKKKEDLTHIDNILDFLKHKYNDETIDSEINWLKSFIKSKL